MESEFPSTVINKGPTWKGFDALRFLVIFGDSYSDVGFADFESLIPSHEEPLGVDFPGVTYAEPGEPNWVGHFITNYANHQLLVYDYAHGGSRVAQVRNQIQVMFRVQIAERPPWAPWKEQDALFVTWVGINDAAYGCEHKDNLKILYNNGARNFVFVNIPAIDRSPARGRKPNYISWNMALNEAANQFSAAHPDATVMIYSSWDTFNALFDNPVAHGFPAEDTKRAGKSMWVDHLHPTSKVHDFVARDLANFLGQQGAFSESV
ncbi:thermolabile hemolysin [Favolaschia claudopus]|uniref:Thermolabile hemolysin n=1 Tax=Favolaschia claudopus TaxID=2862362 RepID=A0AAW0CUY2_9AGAR